MSLCEEKVKYYEELRKVRPLTEDESENYDYYRGNLQIMRWEEENCNMIILY